MIHLSNSMGLGWGLTRDPRMKKVNNKKMKMKEKTYLDIQISMNVKWRRRIRTKGVWYRRAAGIVSFHHKYT